MVNTERLLGNLAFLSKIGHLEGGGVCRAALSEEDKMARDWLKQYMLNLGLEVIIDQAGNMFGVRKGSVDTDPVVFGSHLDTVFTGGLFDGSLGVLAGLEVMESLNDLEIETDRPIVLANFTNEEGVRFAPDMMGSLAFSGSMSIEDIWMSRAYNEERTVKEELEAIGYLGKTPCGWISPHAFIELHIEQGPVLESRDLSIGVVEYLQGIFWTRYSIGGKAAHAGTTPLNMRTDSLLVASMIIKKVREIAEKYNGVGTVGSINVYPNGINIVAERTEIKVDLRNPDKAGLETMQEELDNHFQELINTESVEVDREEMVRFMPVAFDQGICKMLEEEASNLGLSHTRMTSGAGHDAQMMSRVCPSAMIFVPSVEGISHNVKEYTKDQDVINGTNLLYSAVLRLSKLK